MPRYEPGVAHYHSLCRSRSAQISRALSRRPTRAIAPFPWATKCSGLPIAVLPVRTQYALAFTHMLAHKPRRRDFRESAAVPVVAVTARQMLFRDAGVRVCWFRVPLGTWVPAQCNSHVRPERTSSPRFFRETGTKRCGLALTR